MMRSGLGLALLVAALGSACSGSEGSSPTAPTAATSASSSGTSPTNPSCVPSAPGNLRVSVSDGMRAFTWNAVSGAQDYVLLIGSSSGSSNLLSTNTTQTAYSWTGGGAGPFYARVYARNSCGSGPNSSEVTFN